MLNVNRNDPQAFSSLSVSYLFLISFYPFVASLLDVGNGVCFLEHTMASHKTMVPMQIKGYVSQVVAIGLPIHSVVHMFEPVINCETWWKQGLLPNEHIITGGIGD
jgi:hypothetical protein